MKKTAIANWGQAQHGKSATVKKVAQEILKHYPNATTNPASINFNADITVTITIGKIKIGIESVGDPGSCLSKSLKDFEKNNCDIIICSCRTRGETVNSVDSLGNSGYDIIWATNYRSNEKSHDDLNNLSAKQIFELIQDLISGKIQ